MLRRYILTLRVFNDYTISFLMLITLMFLNKYLYQEEGDTRDYLNTNNLEQVYILEPDLALRHESRHPQ